MNSSNRAAAVTAVVVVYNELEELKSCLAALERQTFSDISVIVVDNGSIDGSLEWALERCSDKLEVHSTGADLGFCVAANVGISAARSDYVLNVSPDVTLEPDYVEVLVRAMNADSRIGIAGGKLLRSGPDGLPLPGPLIDTAGHVPRSDGTVGERGHGRLDVGLYDSEEDIFGVTAAAALFRAETIARVSFEGQFFDESFWGYKDDCDVCWRAGRLGWRVRYVPKAVAYHRRGFSGGRDDVGGRRAIPFVARFHSFRNRYLMLLHNLEIRDALPALLGLIWYEVKVFGYILTQERDLLPAYASAFKNAPHALRMRRELRRLRLANPWRRFLTR